MVPLWIPICFCLTAIVGAGLIAFVAYSAGRDHGIQSERNRRRDLRGPKV